MYKKMLYTRDGYSISFVFKENLKNRCNFHRSGFVLYMPCISSRNVSRPFGVMSVCVPPQPVFSLTHSFNSKRPLFFSA